MPLFYGLHHSWLYRCYVTVCCHRGIANRQKRLARFSSPITHSEACPFVAVGHVSCSLTRRFVRRCPLCSHACMIQDYASLSVRSLSWEARSLPHSRRPPAISSSKQLVQIHVATRSEAGSGGRLVCLVPIVLGNTALHVEQGLL